MRRQGNATKEYCRRNGLILDESLDLTDKGVSAFKGRNAKAGGLGRFLDAVERGEVPPGSALIVESLDRISRQSPRKTIRLLDEILEAGIEIHLTMASKVFKPDAPAAEEGMDLMMATLWAIRANEESETKSRRLKEAFEAKRAKASNGDGLVSLSLPWWLIMKRGRIVCPADRAKVVRRIFKLTATGLSSAKIARLLSQEKLPTWRPKAKEWSAARVRDLVRSDAPLGILRPTDKTRRAGQVYEIRGYYPQLIEEELALQARATLRKNLTVHDRGRVARRGPGHLFRGILRSAPSGHWMRLAGHRNGTPDESGEKTWNYYYESLNERTGKMEFAVSAKQLETVLFTGLRELTIDELIPRKGSVVPKSVKLRGRLRDLDAKIENVGKAVEEGSVTMARRLVELEQQREEMRQELKIAEAEESLPPAASDALSRIQSIGPGLSMQPQVRGLLAAHIRRLIAQIDVGGTITSIAGAADEKELLKVITNSEKGVLQAMAGGTPMQRFDDPTEKRYRRPLVIVVHFLGGAKRLIMRRAFGKAFEGILSLRVD